MQKRAGTGWRWPRPVLAGMVSGAAVGILACSWWLASPPPGLTVSDACQPEGVRASTVAWLDPSTYWNAQLVAVRRKLTELEEAPAREAQQAADREAAIAPSMARVDHVLAEMNARNEKLYEELYRADPDLGPSPYSPAAKRASELRAMADAIEREADMAYWRERAERHRLERIAALTRCEKLIAERHPS